MNNQQEYLVVYKNTGEGSGYAIYKHPESLTYELFSIPMYGGEECFEGLTLSLAEAIKEAESWT